MSIRMLKMLLQELQHVIPNNMVCFLYCVIYISNIYRFSCKNGKSIFPISDCPDLIVTKVQVSKTEVNGTGNLMYY